MNRAQKGDASLSESGQSKTESKINIKGEQPFSPIKRLWRPLIAFGGDKKEVIRLTKK
jgi:hypothetical protein